MHMIAQGIAFKPTLSHAKRDAIERMGMGRENKCYVRFTKCFWPKHIPYFQPIGEEVYRFVNYAFKGASLLTHDVYIYIIFLDDATNYFR